MTDQPRPQPNIVLVMADQFIPMLSGAYGHPVVQTPNLNRLSPRACASTPHIRRRRSALLLAPA